MFTPIAPYLERSLAISGSMSDWASAMPSLSSSGDGSVSDVIIPSAPAFETAAARRGVPTHCIPPITRGTRRPSAEVS